MNDGGDLEFCWDDAKAVANMVKHGLSFDTARFAFVDPHRVDEADAFATNEYRGILVGRADNLLIAVIYAEPEEGLIRIISARLASPKERRTYEYRLFHA